MRGTEPYRDFVPPRLAPFLLSQKARGLGPENEDCYISTNSSCCL
jgi:hypothetical protein